MPWHGNWTVPDPTAHAGPVHRPRLGTLLALMAVVAMVALWVYLFAFADPGVPDRLDDPAFGESAQEVCAAARQDIDGLPPAQQARTPQERAETVAEANQVLLVMLDDLGALAPDDGEDAELVGRWLDDWDTYVGDRQEYVQALQAGEDAELLVTPQVEGGGQITETIDHFARINDMVDCQVPLDA